jgi:hypothetical protein
MPWMVLGLAIVLAMVAWTQSPATALVAIAVAVFVVYTPTLGLPLLVLGVLFAVTLGVPFVRYVAAARRQEVDPDRDPTEARDDTRHRSTLLIDEYFDEHTAVLQSMGFVLYGNYVEVLQGPESTTLTFWRTFGGSRGRIRAALHGVVGRKGDIELSHAPSVMFSSLLEGGDMLVTTNATMIVPFGGLRGERVVSVPSMRTADALLRVHRARLERATRAVVTRPTPIDWIEEVRGFRREGLEAGVEAGWYEPVAGGHFRMTWRGALRFSAATFPLLRPVHALLARRNEARLLRDLAIAAPSKPRPRAPALPSSAESALGFVARIAAWAPSGLVVSLVTLLTCYPETFSLPVPGSPSAFAGFVGSRIRVPGGLAVPDSYPLAVATLESLTKKTAEPLVVNDASGQQLPSEIMAVRLPAPDAMALVARAGARFDSAGFLLFHTTQYDGRGSLADAVALAPTPDAYAVMEAIRTNGDNFGIDTDSVTAWLRATERIVPLHFTAIAFDFVGARILGKVDDATALGARFLQFCPEMKSEFGDARRMGRELVRGKLIYCWWD